MLDIRREGDRLTSRDIVVSSFSSPPRPLSLSLALSFSLTFCAASWPFGVIIINARPGPMEANERIYGPYQYTISKCEREVIPTIKENYGGIARGV